MTDEMLEGLPLGVDEEAEEDGDDVALRPSDLADPPSEVRKHIPENILERYEVYSYRSAALLLKEAHPQQFAELMDALRRFSLTTHMIRSPGKNESDIPKRISALLRPMGWYETTIQADLLVQLLWKENQLGTDGKPKLNKKGKEVFDKKSRQIKREKFLDGHKVDYVKNRVAFDLEWNSKDQTFDRDLYAFSAFSQCGVIDVGVLVTRSAELNPVFEALGPALDGEGNETNGQTKAKYGASTTWMGKLLYRLNAGRNGPCPVLALGIRPACIEDWKDPNAT